MVGLKQMVFVHLFPPGLHVLACASNPFFPSWSQPRKLSVDSRKLCSIPSSAVGSSFTDLCHWLFAALLPPVPQPVAPCWRPLCHGAHPCPPLGRSSPDLPLHPEEGTATRRRQTRASNPRLLKNKAQIKYTFSATAKKGFIFGKFRRQFENHMLILSVLLFL